MKLSPFLEQFRVVGKHRWIWRLYLDEDDLPWPKLCAPVWINRCRACLRLAFDHTIGMANLNRDASIFRDLAHGNHVAWRWLYGRRRGLSRQRNARLDFLRSTRLDWQWSSQSSHAATLSLPIILGYLLSCLRCDTDVVCRRHLAPNVSSDASIGSVRT